MKLIGHYFKDKNFSDLMVIDQLDSFKVNCIGLGDLLDVTSEKILSLRYITELIPPETGDYVFSLNSNNYKITIEKKVLNDFESILLEKDKSYITFIEIVFEKPQSLDSLSKLNLKWSFNKKLEVSILSEHLSKPNLSDSKTYRFFPVSSFSKSATRGIDFGDGPLDSDNDNIPDEWEVNGYTVKDRKIVKWDDSYSALGYKKFVSNPLNAHTANDPYTDYEKVATDFDKSILREAQDPLVAAYPVIGVAMERVAISKDTTWNESTGSAISKGTSTTESLSLGSEIGTTVTAGIKDVSVSVSTKLSRTASTANTVQSSNSNSFSKSLNINESHAAYLNANVRYYNSGTAPVYNVKPTTSIVLNNSTIVTILAQPNQVGNTLNPGNTYPSKGLSPISLNTFDQFSSHFITLNYNHLQLIDGGEPIILETTQFEGNYLTKNAAGDSVISGNDWNNYLGQIDSTCIKLILDIDGKTLERRVVAKDPLNPEDKTPVITLREALKKAFNLSELSGKLYYGNKLLSEDEMLIIYDNETKLEIDKQLLSDKSKNLFDVIISSKMSILIRIPIMSKISKWSNTSQANNYFNITSNTTFSESTLTGLVKYKKYLLTMDIKSTNSTTVNISISDGNLNNLNLSQEQLKVQIPFNVWNEDNIKATITNVGLKDNIYFKNINIYEIDSYEFNNQQIQKKFGITQVIHKANGSFFTPVKIRIRITDWNFINHVSHVGFIYNNIDYGLKPTKYYFEVEVIPSDYVSYTISYQSKINCQIYILNDKGEKIIIGDGATAEYLKL